MDVGKYENVESRIGALRASLKEHEHGYVPGQCGNSLVGGQVEV